MTRSPWCPSRSARRTASTSLVFGTVSKEGVCGRVIPRSKNGAAPSEYETDQSRQHAYRRVTLKPKDGDEIRSVYFVE